MPRKLDPDMKALKAAVRALRATTARMRRATLEYLWDRFILHPERDDQGAANELRKAGE